MKEKRLKKTLWFVSVILGAFIATLLVVQFSMNRKITNFKKLTEADQYFLQEFYDSAWVIYNDLNLDYFPDTLLDNRARLQQLKIKEDEKDTVFLEDTMRLELLKKLKSCALFANKEVLENELSDIEIIKGMTDCFLQKSKKLMVKKDIVEELDNTGFLIFKNHNGHDVYYLGEMKDSLAHGTGFGLFSNESYYRGEWENGKRHGEGRFETRVGELYVGTYKYDKRNGFGTYWFRNGDYYKGDWKDSKRDGIGTVYSAEGDTIVYGVWEGDRLNRRKTRQLTKE